MRQIAALALTLACGPREVSSELTTWHADAGPIVTARCGGCHTAGGVAPFALDTFAAAAPMGEVMLSTVTAGSMPPWGALETDRCTPPLPWAHDLRLTDAEVATLRAWVDDGKPEGDPASAPPPPERVSLDLADPDLVLEAPEFVTSGDKDQYECLVIDPGFAQDVWVTAAQLIPGDERVVHHALIWVDPSGDASEKAGPDGHYPCFGGVGVPGSTLLWTWTPGQVPMDVPAGVGMKVPAGSRLILSTHYHPVPGEAVADRSRYALRYTTSAPVHEGRMSLIGNRRDEIGGLLPGPNDEQGVKFFIPAGASDHTETMAITLPDRTPSGRIWGVGTHMHYVGTDMIVELEAGADRTCLVQTPKWDFDWQMVYRYDAADEDLPRFQGGDTFHVQCTFNNTLDNPGVRALLDDQGEDAPFDVSLGEETRDEMCLALIAYYLE